ncbi:MAG: hypothetical protein LN416_07745 [Candidatus Thermoplasmatota archaeon]|nr:hypothetical protein [Candidatus Thermoplasmatota archaeon]
MEMKDIMRLGVDFQYLRLAARNCWIVRSGDTYLMLGAMKHLRKTMEVNMLGQDSIPGLDSWIEKLGKYGEGDDLSEMDGNELEAMVRIWKDRLDSELDNISIIRLDRCMTLNFELLQGGAKGFFSESIWNGLSEISKNDLNEAARCLLCGIPTASAMIGLRATEDVLRGYYKRKTRRNPAKKGWKAIIDELLTEESRGKLKYSVNKSLMGHLDFVRTNRNMVEHPDRVFSKRGAERLFYQVVATITEICEDVGRKKSRGSSGV